MEITADIAREFFSYEPLTGDIRWKKKTTKYSHIRLGSIAGAMDKEYRRIKFFGKSYATHRIAWLITYGQWPSDVIDHIDGNHSNNALSNLRDVSRGINTQNIRKPYSNNTSNLLGVFKHHKKWGAKVQTNKTSSYLGVFDTAELAHQAYLASKRQLHEGNTL